MPDEATRQQDLETLAELRARLAEVEGALKEVARLLGPIGPDEVLDQDVPASEGRRWVISDENGMRLIEAFRIASHCLADSMSNG